MVNYPFLWFWSIVAIPMTYWVGIIELGILGSQDNAFSLTFGQVSSVLFQSAPLWYNPHLPVPQGHRHVCNCTSDHRSVPFGS